MYKGHDRELGMGAAIARRDFLNGVGVALTSSLLLPRDVEAFARFMQQEEYYPPTRTGIRGSHPGSFEVGHRLRDGASFENAVDTGERYDMVVLGAGLSGLSSAYFFHENAGRESRVLLLDNHDDFGGHAKRNEFWHEGQMLLLNGGTSNMENHQPLQYGFPHYAEGDRCGLRSAPRGEPDQRCGLRRDGIGLRDVLQQGDLR